MDNRNDYSKLSEGESAARNMSGANEPGERAPAVDLLTMLAETHKRLAKVEADNAAMREDWERVKNRDGADIDPAQLRHVLMKYFPHDFPDVEAPAVAVPRFDAYTGQPLN